MIFDDEHDDYVFHGFTASDTDAARTNINIRSFTVVNMKTIVWLNAMFMQKLIII